MKTVFTKIKLKWGGYTPLLILALMAFAMPARGQNPSAADVAIIHGIITAQGLTWNSDPGDGSIASTEWATYMTWDNSSPDRIIAINFQGVSLSGTLDLSGLSELQTIDVSGNSLTGLNVTNLANLTTLDVSNNQLIDLDLTGCSSLATFTGGSNMSPPPIFMAGNSTPWVGNITINNLDATASGWPGTVSYSGGTLTSTDNTVGNIQFTTGTAPNTISGTLILKYPVSSITGVPTAATVGTVDLSVATISPTTTVSHTIDWSINSAGTTGATLSGSTLTTTAAGTVVITATVADGIAIGTPYTENFSITVSAAGSFEAVTSITGVPTTGVESGIIDLSVATVLPINATNQAITWTLTGGTAQANATLTGTSLTVTTAGTVELLATVTNGATASTDFTSTHTITVSAFTAVSNITNVPTSTGIGVPLTLTSMVVPSGASNTIVWTVADDGGTGATIASGTDILNTTSAGTVIVKATIVNGATSSTDYVKTFAITVGSATPVAGITLNHTTAKISKGGEKQLIATIAPPNASDKGITWSSSDPSVATVDATGLITAVNTGTATITAMSNNNNLIKASCAVEVVDPEYNIGDVIALNKIISERGDALLGWEVNPDESGNTIPTLGGGAWTVGQVWSGAAGSTNRRLIEINFSNKMNDMISSPAIDVSPFKKLQVLNLSQVNLGTLDVSALTELRELYCPGKTSGSVITKLTELDLSKNLLLEKLDCGWNALTKLDLTNNTALTSLKCDNNQLETINITHIASQLTVFECNYNRMLSVNVSGLPNTVTPIGNNQKPSVSMILNNANSAYEALVTMNAPYTGLFSSNLTYSTGKLSTTTAGTSAKPSSGSFTDLFIGWSGSAYTGGTLNITYYEHATAINLSPLTATVGIPYTFAGASVSPTTAIQDIVWSIKTSDPGNTAAAAISNNQLIISSVGAVVVTGTVVNGLGLGYDYTQDFTITTGQPLYNISDINAINALIDAGSLPSSWVKTTLVDGTDYDASWTGVVWSSATDNKRIDVLNLVSQGLSGNLDVTALTAMTTLNVTGNQLTGLNVTGLTNLTTIECGSNKLLDLDLSTCTSLTTFAGSNQTLAPITLTGVSPTNYEAAFNLTKQLTGLAMGITHDLANVKLKSTDNTVSLTPFNIATGSSFELSGNLSLTYVHFYAVTGIGSVPGAVGIGQTLTLVGAVSPDNANFQTIVWSLNSGDGGTGVTLSGNVLDATSATAGTVTVTATITNGLSIDPPTDYTYDFPISVTTNNPAAIVVIVEAPGPVLIPFGGTSQLTAQVLDATGLNLATNQSVTWTSSVPGVASIHPVSGLVTAVAAGTTYISATSSDGNILSTTSCEVEVGAAILVSSVTLDQNTALIAQGGTLQLTATVAPSNASNQNVTWSTSNPSIATVSTTGLVTVLSTATVAGTVTITATAADGSGYSAQCLITVDTPVAVSGVSLPSTSTVGAGGTLQLTATFTPSNATNQNATWASDNTAVATVDPASGLVTGVSIGSANITVTTADGGYTATCAVTVTANVPATGVTVTPNPVALAPGGTQQLTATVNSATPGVDATNQTISTWYSDDTSVATVSTTGLVTAVGVGTANITATSQEGPFTSANVVITVSSAPSTYLVTVSSTGSGASGGGNYAVGATVGIYAGTAPSGYTFSYWSASPTVTFANSSSAGTSFTMPASAVTVTAHFVATSGPGPDPNPPTDPDLIDIYNAIDLVQFATINIPQSAGNNQTSVSQWLESYFNELFAQQHYYVSVSVTGFSAFESAIAGSAGNPNGTNGSATFSATFSKGSHTVQLSYLNGRIVATSFTSNEYATLQPLKAVAGNGVVFVSGLFAGDDLKIYNISGRLVYNAKAYASEVRVDLARGIYIITCGNRTVKASVR